jgi:hypothetical protein
MGNKQCPSWRAAFRLSSWQVGAARISLSGSLAESGALPVRIGITCER